jgi:hypothetical protein
VVEDRTALLRKEALLLGGGFAAGLVLLVIGERVVGIVVLIAVFVGLLAVLALEGLTRWGERA